MSRNDEYHAETTFGLVQALNKNKKFQVVPVGVDAKVYAADADPNDPNAPHIKVRPNCRSVSKAERSMWLKALNIIVPAAFEVCAIVALWLHFVVHLT